ncbi:MAG: aerobic carbon-monoxide dehydrogenase large subunit [Gaiellaceae bacterium]|jgi:carbon-monoxide dehydrogenase large subunit|nr:aerobic carbon-monoxide dehydrogenase large subunit [Gaiellaceae bacterium]
MATTETRTTARVVGTPVPRKEDRKLVTGHGQFMDNINLPGQLWLSVVRSPYAHATIKRVGLEGARELEGVVAAFSGAELAADWAGSLPCAWPVTEEIRMPSHFPLAFDKARHVGDGVAVVVAESREIAKDAAELVEVEYEPLAAVTDVGRALEPDAPIVHDDFETNECYVWKLDAGEIEQAFADAEVTVKRSYRQQRLVPAAMEPRGALAQELPGTGELTLWSSTQIPHILRLTLAGVVGVPEARLRVIAPDVGGAFGSKLDVYAEEALCLALARRLKRPVKWIEERSEAFNATIHGRDVLQEIELAATAEGKITAVRVRLVSAMGAYLQLVTPGIPLLGAWVYAGCYDIPAYSFECTGVFTHTTPTDAYRGAGRPEATYAIERVVDALATELGMDPVELRRRNFITEFPATIASGLTIDSGDFNASLDRALEHLDLDALRAEQAERRARGDTKELGIGLSTYVEMCGLAPSGILGAIRYVAGGWDAATVRCLPSGTVQVLTGTSPHGQGHETSWSQIAADELGYEVDEIEVLHGDTTVSPLGMDTYGSRSLAVGGIALHQAAQKIVAKARTLAAHQLQVPEDELDYEAGTFTAGDSSVTMKELAFAAWSAHDIPPGFEPGLEATAVYDPPNFSWPGGAHAAVVEIDTETGDVQLIRYVAVDDVGKVVNPMIVDGQIHGGIAQGVAQALFEEAVYDEDGTLLTSSFTNYLVPSAAELPSFELDRTETPSPTNPLGVKGVGETGAIASPAAVMNAVADALAPYGVTDIDMPATPERVWRALEEARR